MVEPVVEEGLIVAAGLVPRVASHLRALDNMIIQLIMLDRGRAMIMTTESVHNHDLEARWYPATQMEARRYPATRSAIAVVYFTPVSRQG